jgi:signal transduction histidine kinase
MQSFYRKFIRPLSKETDQAEREIVLNYLLVGIFALAIVALIDTLLAPVISNEAPHWPRVINNTVTVLFIIGLYAATRYKSHHKIAAIILTGLITLMSCFIALHWGVLLPTGLLLFSLAVVMAGVLIGARYSIYVTCLLVIVMAYLQHGEHSGSLHPDLTWVGTKPTTGDVIGFSAILFLIAFVSWLFNRQMELSLRRARRSEKALKRQKQLLEVKVEKRAQQLEAAQLEKMQELYRFAELGQLSTALFHDLANNLSTVSLDIEGLTAKDHSDIMQRISHNVSHIDTIVKRVREQIRGKSSVEVFSIMDEIDGVVKILAVVAQQSRVGVVIERDKSVKPGLSYKGDIVRFRQIILNLISNGIEAYPATSKARQGRFVTLHLERQHAALLIQVTDHGVGIAVGELPKIFRPFYTTKDKGVGIGLFIVKQVVEKDFNGTVTLFSSKRQGTTVSVNLPKSYYAKVSRN